MPQDSAFHSFIESHIAVVAPLEQQANLAEWELQTTSSTEAKERSAEYSARLEKVYACTEDYAFLCNLKPGDFEDPLLERERILLLNAYRGRQIDEKTIEEIVGLEVDISDRFNTFRAVVGGKEVSDNEIDDTLLDSDDVALRKETWLASKAVGEATAESVLRLVRLRNREAHRLGFSNYYAMSLILQEQEEERLFTLLGELERESATLWTTYKSELDQSLATRFHVPPQELRPWHQANRFFQEPGPGEADLDRFFAEQNLEQITADFFAAINLPIEDMLQKSDLYERAGKCQHAFCIHIDRSGDVRVLCNNRPNERWMSTMLHEFGHAVYDKYIDRSLPYLLREPSHTLTTEAIALFMGRLTKEAAWLRIYGGVAPEEAERIAFAAQQELRDYLLVFMRWCFVMTHFERELYRDPEQDLDTLWWQLVERFQGLVCPPEERRKGMWAAKIHLATAPVYYHNYLLGEMVASQLLNHIKTVVLAGEAPQALVTSPKVGDYMRNQLFRQGATLSWEEWLTHATNEPLNPRYYVNQLNT